ncbi:MAG: transcriptional regulator protein-like protein [Solirubrobacterales bacterium]|jgi:proteasome accessory factor C|nr:transcriptional regulator protein-like protein [Solirubrobacterales bacterium]
MAKDTEKLIRQLSLISFLMANRRPVSALEIKREVEGYSSMNEDAFARRFYADRAELESLGISLQVDKPAEGFFEAELYALPPENYYLPAIEFSDSELAALRTALGLLDGEFAYAEPLRLALQQVSWGRPSPLTEEAEAPIDVKLSTAGSGRELSQRLAKIETAISRRKTIEFSYYSLQRDEVSDRKVNPYHLVFRDGQFYLIGYSHERDQVRVFRLSRIRGKVSYATKAEHDFTAPEDFDRRDYGKRADWQMGEIAGRARIFLRERIAWLVERDFGRHGELRKPKKADGIRGRGSVFETEYASSRQLISWVLSWRENARLLEPPELAADADERLALLRDRHRRDFEVAETVRRPLADGNGSRPRSSNGRSESVIRPERFARLVTLAGLLIGAARDEGSLPTRRVLEELNISLDELREDLDVLNVVNFGGGTYVLYAEIDGDRIEVDPDTYGDNFARPARLLPLEAKALVAAIDLFGDHLPQSGLQSARRKIVGALGHDPSEEGLEIAPGRDDSSVVRTVNEAIRRHRVLELQYYKENEDEFSKREVEPYQLVSGPEGWYLGCFDLDRTDTRHFRLDRMKEAVISEREFEHREGVEQKLAEQEWLVHGEVTSAGVARVWVSPARARWLREERTVVEELDDGAVVVELPYGSNDWLVREVLKGVGDLVVLEPSEAREAVLKAVGSR